MKKILLTISILILLSIGVQAQNPTALYARGGYSWFTGVVGAEMQIGKIGIGGGWMPTKRPLSGERENAFGIDGTLYSGNYDENSLYFSVAYIVSGYRHELSNGDYYSEGMFGIMGGYKIASEVLDLKMGIGAGFHSEQTVFTFEITLGLNMLGM
jgi:hypothetical protein